MKKMNVFLLIVAILSVSVSLLFLNSCQKDLDYERIDEKIAISSEFEDFVIASIDFQQAMNVFEKEMRKVDLVNAEIVVNSEGKRVIYLSDSIRNLHIEDKAKVMNDKKAILLHKYPQFSTWNLKKIKAYIDYAAETSVRINDKFLEIGINKCLQLTKSGSSEMFYSQEDMMSYMANWMVRPDYVEAYIIVYYNGTREVYVDDRNTATESYLQFTYNDGQPTRNGDPIFYVAHTHQSGHTPGEADLAIAAMYPGLKQGIYYNGSIEFYNWQ